MFSTVENPTHFQTLGQTTNHVPHLNTTPSPNTSRITWTEVGGGTLASNVAVIEFNFTTPCWTGKWLAGIFRTSSLRHSVHGAVVAILKAPDDILHCGLRRKSDARWLWRNTGSALRVAQLHQFGDASLAMGHQFNRHIR